MSPTFALDTTVSSISPITKDGGDAAAAARSSSPPLSFAAQLELLHHQSVARKLLAGWEFNGGATTCPLGYVFETRRDWSVCVKPSLASVEKPHRFPRATTTAKGIPTRASERLRRNETRDGLRSRMSQGTIEYKPMPPVEANAPRPTFSRRSYRIAIRNARNSGRMKVVGRKGYVRSNSKEQRLN